MKKVAVIGLKGLPALGGTAVVGQNIIEQLKGKYEFTVYASSSHTSISNPIEGVKQLVFKKFFIGKLNIFYYYLVSALHALFRGNYDFIHLHLIDGAYILPLLRLRYKVISTTHGRPQTVGKWNFFVRTFFLLNERIFFLFSNLVTSVSLPLIDEYRKFTNKEISYIPNGLNFQKDENLNISRRDEGYLLFSARRIIECKGAHILLKALQSIEYKGKIKIIGELDQVKEYKLEIEKLSKGLDIDFVGLITDKELLYKYLRNAHIFIFPSLQEAMSVMLLEVAFAKLPLICSDIPANRAIFNESETTFFKSGDADDLAKKIKQTDENYQSAIEKSNLAYQTLKNNYSWEQIAFKYNELYEKIR